MIEENKEGMEAPAVVLSQAPPMVASDAKPVVDKPSTIVPAPPAEKK